MAILQFQVEYRRVDTIFFEYQMGGSEQWFEQLEEGNSDFKQNIIEYNCDFVFCIPEQVSWDNIYP